MPWGKHKGFMAGLGAPAETEGLWAKAGVKSAVPDTGVWP